MLTIVLCCPLFKETLPTGPTTEVRYKPETTKTRFGIGLVDTTREMSLTQTHPILLSKNVTSWQFVPQAQLRGLLRRLNKPLEPVLYLFSIGDRNHLRGFVEAGVVHFRKLSTSLRTIRSGKFFSNRVDSWASFDQLVDQSRSAADF